MRTDIVFCNEQSNSDECVFSEGWMKNVVEKCLECENVAYDCEVGITFTDDEQIRILNREHRGIDRATDVLSFPMLDNPQNPQKYDMTEENKVLLGDIVISLERAERQAEEYGHGYEREIAFLIVHSMMHLLGYDHIEDEERAVMRKHEDAVLEELQILR